MKLDLKGGRRGSTIHEIGCERRKKRKYNT